MAPDKLHLSYEPEEMIDKVYKNEFELLLILHEHIIKLITKYLFR